LHAKGKGLHHWGCKIVQFSGLALLAIRDSEVASESQGGRRRADEALGVRGRRFRQQPGGVGGIATIEGPIVGVIVFYLL
jgi:hypothetical protein